MFLGLALYSIASLASAGEPSTQFVFPRLNGTFRDMAPEIAPVSAGGLSIVLSSPANSLTIRAHELELEPLGGGLHRFRGMVDFLGKADLVAVFEATVPGRLEDQVLLPIQRVELEGELEILRVAEGYDVTTRKLPEHADVAMQSRLGNQLLSICDLMSIFTGGECGGLEQAFSRVRLPLPPPGETYHVRAEELTAEEREILDAYLAFGRLERDAS
jgi:hypothetical protein